ncbi:uncharacterized protein LOC106069227 [Biomphalaria glabrata]|uniref:Uncharacterized protein LOC106069227 n=1 Tax=Biomphalaria glabrata TaxID=6526 RepID=A0A9W3ASY0_BIOGL|nr:uncharacterized protein LOC106069227 [Biomphalaria glabrata]
MLTPSVVKMDDKKQAELAGDGKPRPQIQTVCAELGRLAPSVVQMEDNIQAELAGDGTPLPRPQNQICDIMSLNERVCHEWKNLPLLVIMNIFSYLTDNEMRIFSQVCQSWYTKFLLIYWCTNLTLQLKLIDNRSLDRVTGLISRKIRQLEISYVSDPQVYLASWSASKALLIILQKVICSKATDIEHMCIFKIGHLLTNFLNEKNWDLAIALCNVIKTQNNLLTLKLETIHMDNAQGILVLKTIKSCLKIKELSFIEIFKQSMVDEEVIQEIKECIQNLPELKGE